MAGRMLVAGLACALGAGPALAWAQGGGGIYTCVDGKGRRISFAFRGKSGVRHSVNVSDRRLARIVLSPARFLTASPGALKNDATILPQ